MRHRPLTFLAAALCIASATTGARPQSSSSGQTTPAANQPSATNDTSNTPAPPGQKKVWTNEDVPDLRGQSVISTVGDPNAKHSNKPATAAKNSGASKSYQAQIERLQAQIPPLDAQIAELQSAIDGKPTGDAKTSQRPRGVKADDWSVEMQELQKKKDALLDQIAALKDQARHQGVSPNTLP
jgi:chaperonin cofactor prefoldin